MKTKIADMIIEFSTANNIAVVAEEVEDMEMVEFVEKMGIKLIQGYLISHPLDFQEFKEFIKKDEYLIN